MTTTIPTQREYEARERQMLNDHLHMVEALPVYERKEAFAQFLAMCRTDDAASVAERVSWLLAGNYGYGAYQASRQMIDLIDNPKPALFRLIASLNGKREISMPRRLGNHSPLRSAQDSMMPLAWRWNCAKRK